MDGSSPARKARARAIVQRMGTPVFGHSASMPVVGSTPVFWSDLMREANDYRQAPLPPSGEAAPPKAGASRKVRFAGIDVESTTDLLSPASGPQEPRARAAPELKSPPVALSFASPPPRGARSEPPVRSTSWLLTLFFALCVVLLALLLSRTPSAAATPAAATPAKGRIGLIPASLLGRKGAAAAYVRAASASSPPRSRAGGENAFAMSKHNVDNRCLHAHAAHRAQRSRMCLGATF